MSTSGPQTARATELALRGGAPVRATPLPTPPRATGPDALENVRRVLESGHLNRTAAVWVKRLEEEFAAFYGTAHCTASTSGTSAIHVAVGALNPEPGDEIITAPITDMGTVIPILAQNAIPVFADVERDTFNLDPADVERRITPRTRAIVPVHLGVPLLPAGRGHRRALRGGGMPHLRGGAGRDADRAPARALGGCRAAGHRDRIREGQRQRRPAGRRFARFALTAHAFRVLGA